MANFLTYFKKYNPNLYSLLVSLLIAIWYNGITGMLNYYLPNRGPFISLILLVIPITIFITDNGRLDELYVPPQTQYPAIASTQQFQNVKDDE